MFKIQIEIFQNDLQKAAPFDMKQRKIVLLKLLNSIFEDVVVLAHVVDVELVHDHGRPGLLVEHGLQV